MIFNLWKTAIITIDFFVKLQRIMFMQTNTNILFITLLLFFLYTSKGICQNPQYQSRANRQNPLHQGWRIPGQSGHGRNRPRRTRRTGERRVPLRCQRSLRSATSGCGEHEHAGHSTYTPVGRKNAKPKGIHARFDCLLSVQRGCARGTWISCAAQSVGHCQDDRAARHGNSRVFNAKVSALILLNIVNYLSNVLL